MTGRPTAAAEATPPEPVQRSPLLHCGAGVRHPRLLRLTGSAAAEVHPSRVKSARPQRHDRGADASLTDRSRDMDMKLEVLTIPVSDVERAKEFDLKLGWRLDETPDWVVQFTPPVRRARSTSARTDLGPPGSSENNYLIVSDIEATHRDLVERGIDVSEVFHLGDDGPESGPAPGHATYSSLATIMIPTATAGRCRRSPIDCPGAWRRPRRRSARPATSPAHCAVPRRPTGARGSATAGRTTRTGPTGTPSTWRARPPGRLPS